jgi:hypothetical protein
MKKEDIFLHATKAYHISKSDKLYKYSNPISAQRAAYQYLGKNAIIYKSINPKKKYMIFDPHNEKWIYFGTMDPAMEDFTKHKDPERRRRYLLRAGNMNGNWRSNPYSANNLSIHVLW